MAITKILVKVIVCENGEETTYDFDLEKLDIIQEREVSTDESDLKSGKTRLTVTGIEK